MTDYVDVLAACEAACADIGLIEEDDAAAVLDAAIAVMEAVDRRIELIVATQGHQYELI